MVQFMCNVIHGVKVFGIKKILCRRYLIRVIYVNKKSLTIKRYILVGCYFCTYFFHLLNFNINKVVSFDINLFIYLLMTVHDLLGRQGGGPSDIYISLSTLISLQKSHNLKDCGKCVLCLWLFCVWLCVLLCWSNKKKNGRTSVLL